MRFLPNILTLSRIFLIPLIVLCYYLAFPLGNWVSFSLYVIAGVSDFLDGYFARKLAVSSSLGRMMDPIADKLLILAVVFMLIERNVIEGIGILAAAIIVSREIAVAGLREFLSELNAIVPVSRIAKWKTTFQILSLGFFIVGNAGPDFFSISCLQIGNFLFWMSAILTVITGYSYFKAGLTQL